MIHCKQQPYNSVWVWADSQEELGLTFMRFQEYYESANPNFRDNILDYGKSVIRFFIRSSGGYRKSRHTKKRQTKRKTKTKNLNR
jgi:hypothetical protein